MALTFESPADMLFKICQRKRKLVMEIKENAVYTPQEARDLLKISSSTMTRMIKGGLIGVAKIGKQYRIMGKEILRIVSPQLEDKVGQLYNKGRRWVHEEGEFIPKKKLKSPIPKIIKQS